jgi:AraC-like DNA-binding protein
MTSTSLNLVVAAAGLVMAAIVGWRAGRRPDALLAALLAAISVGSAMIALQHATRSAVEIDVYERIEYFCGFVLGPLLLLFTRGEWNGRDWRHFVPAFVLPPFVPPIGLLMLHQFAYTGAAAAAWRKKRPAWPGAFIAFFAAIHVAQVVRFSFSDVAWLRNVVPTSVSFAILGIALTGFQSAFPRVPRKYARSARPRDANALLDAVRRRMTTEKLFADCDLSLDSLAAKLGMTPHQLSQLLNESARESFRDFIARFRLEDFCARLRDPANDSLTIEGIALQSGFGSRSGLYAAFQRYAGMTPVQYRAAARMLSMPDGVDKTDAPHR